MYKVYKYKRNEKSSLTNIKYKEGKCQKDGLTSSKLIKYDSIIICV